MGHDGVWCYDFERNVSGYLAIPTNNRMNEMTCRVLFTRVQKQLYAERHGLLADEEYVLAMHKLLKLPLGICKDESTTVVCKEWHNKCMLVASSEKIAMELFKKAASLPSIPCKSMWSCKIPSQMQ